MALEGQMLWALLTLLGVARAWGDFTAANPLTSVFVAAMALLLVGGVTLYATMESRRRQAQWSSHG